MKKIIINYFTLLALSLLPAVSASAYTTSYQVSSTDIRAGYVSQRVWLKAYATPKVVVSAINYTPGVPLPADAKTGDINNVTVRLGMDRKKPFAVISVPAYKASAETGKADQVVSYTLDVIEADAPPTNAAAKTTAVTNSVLATGSWHKIGLIKTGLYKLDAAFFTSMGINIADINPANIRIFGNGGTMLSEDNAQPRISDLAENDIWVNDGGDNAFNAGDYVVFYGVGPTAMLKDSANQRFGHLNNLYSDTAYYFITINNGPGARIQTQTTVPTANTTATTFNYFDVSDMDLVNPTGYSKTWLGEKFSPDINITTKSFNFDLGDYMTSLNCKVGFVCNQDGTGSSINVSMNGAPVGRAVFERPTFASAYVMMTHLAPNWTVPCNSNTANFTITFNASPASAKGFLDYIEINGRRNLNIPGNQLNFRDWQSTGAGKITNYQLSGANGNTRVLDVTDPQHPVIMQGSLSGSTYSFTQNAQMLHEFAAMNNDALYSAYYIGNVANQNLHATGPADFIIVTDPSLVSAAQRLADYHINHDHLRTVIATTKDIYNEFSSGAQDLSAIRDFVRMMYKNAGTDTANMPRYLLLLGSASYDYKHRIPNNCNLVPTFEAADDSNSINSFLSDDFFGFLDDSENIENEQLINTLDIGIGRISARNLNVANDVVTKIIHYKSTATLGPWRLSTMFAADNNDGAGFHAQDAEEISAQLTRSTENLYNEQKIYLDVIPFLTTPAGDRCPNANTSLNDQIYKGAFMINYNGHGRNDLLAHERILTQDDYSRWSNINMLPFMITATCDFGQFDHPEFISAAEQLLFDAKGGVIAMITTTQAVFSTYNKDMNREYVESQFTRNADGRWNTFGDAVRIGKNLTYISSHSESQLANFRKWTLLGDPALTPNFPENKVTIDSILDGATMEVADSVRALGKYTIKGSVRDIHNSLLTNFNGTLTMSFYDKARTVSFPPGCALPYFKIQDNLAYKGKVSVNNGEFSITFITPKDINYFFGKGKISAYAENGITDAAGMDTSVAIGGFSANPVNNDVPPIVRPFMNDSAFINGGITGTNTSLFVILNSETGINVSGYSIGHDLTAVLDDKVELPFILNDYYETAPNTYQMGFVNYPLTGLADGVHTIKVKAWDVNNNVGEGTVDFIVIKGEIFAVQNLGNYPNPFSGLTHFVFEHNHPDEQMDVQIDIFNTAGALAKTIKETFTPSGSRSSDITWDGTDNGGSPLPSGVYVYRLNISTEKGYKTSAYQKLVIIR